MKLHVESVGPKVKTSLYSSRSSYPGSQEFEGLFFEKTVETEINMDKTSYNIGLNIASKSLQPFVMRYFPV